MIIIRPKHEILTDTDYRVLQRIEAAGRTCYKVVGIAANSGVGFEELNAAIATLTAKGMETPEAITAIKGVITAIISPSKEAAEAAAKLGR